MLPRLRPQVLCTRPRFASRVPTLQVRDLRLRAPQLDFPFGMGVGPMRIRLFPALDAEDDHAASPYSRAALRAADETCCRECRAQHEDPRRTPAFHTHETPSAAEPVRLQRNRGQRLLARGRGCRGVCSLAPQVCNFNFAARRARLWQTPVPQFLTLVRPPLGRRPTT